MPKQFIGKDQLLISFSNYKGNSVLPIRPRDRSSDRLHIGKNWLSYTVRLIVVVELVIDYCWEAHLADCSRLNSFKFARRRKVHRFELLCSKV